jgi:hypothetical protein
MSYEDDLEDAYESGDIDEDELEDLLDEAEREETAGGGRSGGLRRTWRDVSGERISEARRSPGSRPRSGRRCDRDGADHAGAGGRDRARDPAGAGGARRPTSWAGGGLGATAGSARAGVATVMTEPAGAISEDPEGAPLRALGARSGPARSYRRPARRVTRFTGRNYGSSAWVGAWVC